jgi:pantoate--beta-alanine ligase
MKIIRHISELRELLLLARQDKRNIGFVPTMGALHEGHISLVKRCIIENEVCVVSIFVNPTQFNDKSDLWKYPRTLEADTRLLAESGCDIVFAPDEKEMYPETDTRVFDFGPLEQVMEGAHRPGHFNGVAQIVSKLFDVVQPNRAYFGEKDYQQIAIIHEMARQLAYNQIEIVTCPILREASGLAFSSRNTRLTEEQRVEAAKIYRTLFKARELTSKQTVQELKEWVITTINASPDLQVEYFDVVNGKTLQPISSWEDTDCIMGCIAVFCGKIRLIDNILLPLPKILLKNNAD